LKYFALPQFANADIMAIYLQYAFDTTGGDPSKHPPLSRAHFYSVAPEEKRRKRKPELHKVDCFHCHKPVRIRVEEVEEQGPPIRVKKKKSKKMKKKKKEEGTEEGSGKGQDSTAEGQEGPVEGTTEAKDEEKKEEGEGTEEKKSEGEEKKEGEGKEEEVEFIPGPMVKRIKVEVVPPQLEEAAPPVKRERLKRKRGDWGSADAVEEPQRTPKKRGRPKKERPALTITQGMIPLLQSKPQSSETAGGGAASSAATDQEGDVAMSGGIQPPPGIGGGGEGQASGSGSAPAASSAPS